MNGRTRVWVYGLSFYPASIDHEYYRGSTWEETRECGAIRLRTSGRNGSLLIKTWRELADNAEMRNWLEALEATKPGNIRTDYRSLCLNSTDWAEWFARAKAWQEQKENCSQLT